MLYSKSAEYAIQAMIYLAEHEARGLAMVSTIADAYDIPRHFLAKLVQSMTRAHLIKSFRGRNGGIKLADLESRLSRLPVFHSTELDETNRIKALQLRARFRGLELPDETANYLLSRNRRDMTSLYQLLDKLDTEALIAKRRLTIPFVRGVLLNRG